MKNKNTNYVVIAGGGTGGHLFPAIAISKFKLSKYSFIYFGSKFGIESKYFNESKFPKEWIIHLLDIRGIQRDFSIKSIIKNLLFPYKFLKSYFYTKKIIRAIKPKLIIGTGGYSSGIPLLVGVHLGIPTLIQEQNSIPGLVTRKLSKKVTKICTAYELPKTILRTNNICLTGNPINNRIKKINKEIAKNKLGIVNKKTILFLGGSQGAVSINNHFIKNAQFYSDNKFHVILQCGQNNYGSISNKLKNKSGITIKPFFNDMIPIYSAADLIIARAGALTISEITLFGKAMILIPFKYAADNHQKINAEIIENKKASITIDEDNLQSGILEKTINNIFSSNQIKVLEKNSIKASYPLATENIWKEIDKII